VLWGCGGQEELEAAGAERVVERTAILASVVLEKPAMVALTKSR
jgi:hypothetical protein